MDGQGGEDVQEEPGLQVADGYLFARGDQSLHAFLAFFKEGCIKSKANIHKKANIQDKVQNLLINLDILLKADSKRHKQRHIHQTHHNIDVPLDLNPVGRVDHAGQLQVLLLLLFRSTLVQLSLLLALVCVVVQVLEVAFAEGIDGFAQVVVASNQGF